MSDESLLAFVRALSDAVRSGLSPAVTLRELDAAHGRGLAAAADKVAAGAPIHESLPPSWPPLLRALLRAGEESGKVDAFLERYASWLELRIAFRRRLARAAIYPLFALFVAAVLFVLFSAKGAPLLLQPLIDAGGEPPAGALRVIALGQLLLSRGYLLLGAGAALYFLLGALGGTSAYRRLRAFAGHWLPGARYALEEARRHEFASSLSLLLAAGLRPRQIGEILLAHFEEDPVTRRRCERGAAALSEGKSYAESLGENLPPEDRSRLLTAEKAGRLDETLGRLAQEHGERHAHRLKVVGAAFQLGLVCALAPVTFGLVLWIMQPALALLKSAVLGNPGPAPLYRELAKPAGGYPQMSEPAPADFNETQAKGVVDFMGERGVKSQKPVPKPKLQPRPLQKRIEPTRIDSGFDR
jgi:general secretion pathway protein F